MKKYLYIAAALVLVAALTFGKLYFDSRKELKRVKANAEILLLERNNLTLLLNTSEMGNLIKKDSIEKLLKDNGIKQNRITELSKIKVEYKDKIVTVLKDTFVFLNTYRIVKYSDYFDGHNYIKNILVGDTLTNEFTGTDSLYLVDNWYRKGWKIVPGFLKKKESRLDVIKKNPRMNYHVEYTTKKVK